MICCLQFDLDVHKKARYSYSPKQLLLFYVLDFNAIFANQDHFPL